METVQKAEKNIRYYVFLRIFAKRVFLPLSAIYFIAYGGFTLQTIGLLASFYAMVQLFAELPTGYLADKIGKAYSIRIGAFLNVIATLLYVFYANKTGILIGQFLEALGYSFLSGAGDALVHDSLVVTRREGDYTRVVSHAQSRALLINAGIIALVPMTYKIDPRLPFLIGTVAYVLLLLAGFKMHDVAIRATKKVRLRRPSFKRLLQFRGLLVYGLLFGAVAAFYTAPSDFNNIAMKEFGLKPELLGWVFAAASLVGALLGRYFHHLKEIPLRAYLYLDSFINVLSFLAIFSGNLVVLLVTFLINMSFWRYRKFIYQDYFLRLYPTKYKATLLSAMNYTEELNSIWIPAVVSFLVGVYGLEKGFGVFSIIAALICAVYIHVSLRILQPKKD